MNAAGTADATVAAQWNGTTWTILDHAEPGDVQRAPLGVVHLGCLLLRRRREQPDGHGRRVAGGRDLERQYLVAADRSRLTLR